MAENTSSGISGAVASVTGIFQDAVKAATPAVQSYFDYRAARETSKASVTPGIAGNAGTASGGQAANVIPAASGSITSKPWFLPVVGGVILLLTLGGAALLMRERKK